MKKKSKLRRAVSLSDQVANILNVIHRMEGRWVVQRWKKGEWQKRISVNPLMGDGGIQPPGEPLYGPEIWPSRERADEAAANIKARFDSKPLPSHPPYGCMEKEGAWWECSLDNNGECYNAFHRCESREEAEARAAKDNDGEMEMRLRVVPATEDIAQHARLIPYTTEDEVFLAESRLFKDALKRKPELAQTGVAEENPIKHWVGALPADEVVDVALNRKRDGISEDCFITTAGELFAAGFGEMSFERNGLDSVVVWCDDLATFDRIQRLTES